jgi:hypothetical protein
MALLLTASFVCAMHARADASAGASASTSANAANANASASATRKAAPTRVVNDEVVNQRVQAAGRGSHLGRELCGVPSARIAHVKESLRRLLNNPPDFDSAWDYGWRRADSVLLQYQALRASDPQDYESRVRLICVTLRRHGERIEKQSGSPPSPKQ